MTARAFLKSTVFSLATLRTLSQDLREPLSPIAHSFASGGEKFEKRPVSHERKERVATGVGRGRKEKRKRTRRAVRASPDFILSRLVPTERHNARGVPRFLARRGHYERAKQRKSVSIIPC